MAKSLIRVYHPVSNVHFHAEFHKCSKFSIKHFKWSSGVHRCADLVFWFLGGTVARMFSQNIQKIKICNFAVEWWRYGIDTLVVWFWSFLTKKNIDQRVNTASSPIPPGKATNISFIAIDGGCTGATGPCSQTKPPNCLLRLFVASGSAWRCTAPTQWKTCTSRSRFDEFTFGSEKQNRLPSFHRDVLNLWVLRSCTQKSRRACRGASGLLTIPFRLASVVFQFYDQFARAFRFTDVGIVSSFNWFHKGTSVQRHSYQMLVVVDRLCCQAVVNSSCLLGFGNQKWCWVVGDYYCQVDLKVSIMIELVHDSKLLEFSPVWQKLIISKISSSWVTVRIP